MALPEVRPLAWNTARARAPKAAPIRPKPAAPPRMQKKMRKRSSMRFVPGPAAQAGAGIVSGGETMVGEEVFGGYSLLVPTSRPYKERGTVITMSVGAAEFAREVP